MGEGSCLQAVCKGGLERAQAYGGVDAKSAACARHDTL